MSRGCALWLLAAAPGLGLFAQPQDRDRTLVVVNADSALSGQIADYYARRRGIAESHLCRVRAGTAESIDRAPFISAIERPVGLCLDRLRGVPVHYLVLTAGLPLRVLGTLGPEGTQASVDSELATLYAKRARLTVPVEGGVANPMFGKIAEPFDQRRFPVYLVGRLAAYDISTVKRMIDHALVAEDRGNYVFDMKEGENENQGDRWLNSAALQLPQGRVVVESTLKILTGQRRVLGYASWGSNDSNRKQRLLGFEWLPGSVATEFVSTNGRTLARPPAAWNLGNDWRTPQALFADTPQSMAADYLAEGATAVTGHTDEPYLNWTPRPDILFPAYARGRTLGEAYTASLQKLSWRNILLGDPLMRLAPRR
ncbi:MAG: TIGR03790 family protein [Bryobacterales bacterium]|nr:TIGR03790 family protein [Bryobacterales bacterium]